MYCYKCGKEVNKDDNFCGSCGALLNENKNEEQREHTARLVDEKDPIFRRECEYCLSTIEYKLKDLGYRPWYPKGFVYCPKCKKPLRHSHKYMIDVEK